MKTKTKMIYLLFSIGLAIFSIQAVYAQKESTATVSSAPISNSILQMPLSPFYNYNALNQDPNISLKTKEFYLQRSKNQKTAGWILFGAGTAMVIVGTIGVAKYAAESYTGLLTGEYPDDTKGDTYSVIMLTGAPAQLVSIPFFISAHHNKNVASSISLGSQNIYYPQNRSYCQNAVPMITLTIKL